MLPLLDEISGNAGGYQVLADGAVVVRWRIGLSRELTLCANLSDKRVQSFPRASGTLVWNEGGNDSDGAFDPWSVRWSIGNAELEP
ncbi:MAG: DUF3459 domain-containing protein [Bryobacteraceae bacterium]